MVKRKIPKTELRRHIRETPFTRDEVQRLWTRFAHMDGDGSNKLNYQVSPVYLTCLPFGATDVLSLHCR